MRGWRLSAEQGAAASRRSRDARAVATSCGSMLLNLARLIVLATPALVSAEAPLEDVEVDGLDAVIELSEPDRDASVARHARVLEEIVVTAQKTQQTLQEVPVAVSVVGAEQLHKAGVFGAEGIENFVPNVELDTDPQAPTIGIRGFSTDTYNIGLEPSVGIIFDEVPLSRTEFIPDGLFDVSRVEVLRGPQGTLFGKNTIAGVLIFATQEPGLQHEGQAILSGGAGMRRLEAAQNLPLSPSLSARLAGVSWHDPGEVRNRFLQRRELASDQAAGRLRLAWDVSDRMALRAGIQVSDTTVNYSPWQLYDVDPDALDYARSKDPEAEDDPFDAHNGFDLPGFVERRTQITHLIVDYDLNDWLQLSVIGGLAGSQNALLMDFDVSAADLLRVAADPEIGQESLELRLTGGRQFFGHHVDVVGGLFVFRAGIDMTVDVALGDDILEFFASPAGMEALGAPQGLPVPLLPLPGEVLDDGVSQYFEQDALSLAAFGQATVALSPQCALIAGLRLGRDRKDARLRVSTRPQPEQLSISAQVIGAENFSRDLARQEADVSPKLGLLYDFNDDLSAYASWTRGFKSGGFNGIAFADQSEGDGLDEGTQLQFEPERGDNFEIGFKARLAGGAMRLNATVYHTDVNNMQVTSFNGISFDVFNAAEARLQGIEVDLSWLTPWPWLSLNAAVAVARAEYRHYPNAPVAAERDDGSGSQDLSGRTLPKAPKITAALNPVLSLPLGKALGMQFGMGFSYRGDQYLEVDLDSHSHQPGHLLLGSFIHIGPLHERWGFTLRGENLADEKALAFVADHNVFADSYFAAQIPQRRFSASLLLRW